MQKRHYYILDLEFNYPSYFSILVWKNGEFYDFDHLEDVSRILNNDILSRENIISIYNIHKSWDDVE
ncbi:MAG TPA: hypothetical protein VIK94_01460 [Bacilli bacterium]